ncbi:TetR/AcrR family transcriptional regulator [Kitasatospora atroaurantiaca]|uniref:TetR family transcriptional regulator n=1 Tax=Kitasatospora atroaurantiaca TaxID=285545 RepID=A0A561ETF0_9ACTN|nr:TetR/AcrR family transcriptional regulator [Kitasatospora atroaurantiaca]TWE18889.1 TetR family transcriptional regulator [Kitasatospora atroaurantiaca]
MPRVGLTPAAVVAHALELIDEQGAEALTLAAVATRAGVATPSLYKHVTGGLAELRRLIAVRVTEELAEQLATAVVGRSGDDAVQALLRAYLGYASRYPQRYAALPQAPQEDADLTQAAARLVGVILAVLRGYGLEGEEAIHAARTVRSTAHGFASLTTGGAFRLAADLAVTEDRLVRVLTEGLKAWPQASGPTA